MGKEVQEAFERCITKERAAEIFWQQKMAEAWFRAEVNYQDDPSEVTGNCKDGKREVTDMKGAQVT